MSSTNGSWLDAFTQFVTKVDDFVWGIPLISLILFGGILLTVRLGGLQFRHLALALKYLFKDEKDVHGAHGEVSSFAALCTALSATIGTGNIVGVATAYVTGGPGALFWMWIAALFGMATKYAEGVLAVKYRERDKATGSMLGGPFLYIERGMGPRWKPLAATFAFFGALAGLGGIGTFTQINSICSAAETFVHAYIGQSAPITLFGVDYSLTTVIGSFALAVLVALVIIGGLKRISSVAAKVVPLMVVMYVLFTLLLLSSNLGEIPSALALIIKGAFNPSAATGGAVGTIFIAMQKGVSRGIFSNEAGLGSAPIAAAAARTKEPARQGLVSMTGTFLDTIIVCSMTGLALTITGQKFGNGALQGAAATMQAFREGLPFLPCVATDCVLTLSLIIFGYTTILGWCYYSERCLEYLTHRAPLPTIIFRWLYIAAIFTGPYMTISAVWGIADIFNGLMAIPNMIALIALSGVTRRETKSYFKRLKSGKSED